jgi:hypothetical protein
LGVGYRRISSRSDDLDSRDIGGYRVGQMTLMGLDND